MTEKRMCPHCGSQMFMSKIIRPCLVEATTDPNEPYKVLKENKDKYDIEIVGCARCRETLVEEDLVTGVKCKECGRIVGPMDINEDGICHVCVAVKQRAELANASREDLIQMLLNAERNANPIAKKMEKQIEKANSVPVTDDAVGEQNDTEQPSTEDKKPKRKASRKKKEDDTVEDNNEPDITQEAEASVSTESINDLANQQEAPFPDLSMNPPEENVQIPDPVPTVTEQPVVEEEQPIGADFRMFEDGEEPF